MLKWRILNAVAMIDGITCILVTIVGFILTAITTDLSFITLIEEYMCALPLLVGSYMVLRLIANKYEPNVETHEVNSIGD